jgi:uncharacterized protein (DUF2236 family)
MWKVVRHRAILLHGPAAAVLQIAHPRIGLGVMEHSRFEASPLGRLTRTLDAVYAIAFGTRDEAEAAAARVARRHATVTGDASAHGVPGPPRYSAGEQDLLLWVVATLVWSAVGGYERAIGPLDDDEKDRFYRDMRTLGAFFDLPPDLGPQTWAEHVAWFDRQVKGEQLGSHPVSRRVAWAVARPRTPWWFRLAGPPITFIFSEILPPPVARRLGFRSTCFSRGSLAVATFALRLFSRFAPSAVRLVPQYRRALAAARDRGTAAPSCGSFPAT